MMRLTTAETALSKLDQTDRQLIRQLALARANITLTDYAKFRKLTRQGAFSRLQEGPLSILFEKIRLHAATCFPEIYFLKDKFAYAMNPDYQAPRTNNTLLDGLLRYAMVTEFEDDGIWSHNVRQAAVYVTQADVHVADCMDRSIASVFDFTQKLKTEGKTIILHSAHQARIGSFEMLMQRTTKGEKVIEPIAPKENLTWDTLFSDQKKTSSTPKDIQKTTPITIKTHNIYGFKFKEAY